MLGAHRIDRWNYDWLLGGTRTCTCICTYTRATQPIPTGIHYTGIITYTSIPYSGELSREKTNCKMGNFVEKAFAGGCKITKFMKFSPSKISRYTGAGAYEPPKAVKMHATTIHTRVPSKCKFKYNTFQIWKCASIGTAYFHIHTCTCT